MLLDIVSLDGQDLVIAQTEAPRAANILSVQVGSLEYLPDFGIDLRYWLTSETVFQNASFKAYCAQKLIEQKINVAAITEVVERLYQQLQFDIGSSETTTTGGMIS